MEVIHAGTVPFLLAVLSAAQWQLTGGQRVNSVLRQTPSSSPFPHSTLTRILRPRLVTNLPGRISAPRLLRLTSRNALTSRDALTSWRRREDADDTSRRIIVLPRASASPGRRPNALLSASQIHNFRLPSFEQMMAEARSANDVRAGSGSGVVTSTAVRPLTPADPYLPIVRALREPFPGLPLSVRILLARQSAARARARAIAVAAAAAASSMGHPQAQGSSTNPQAVETPIAATSQPASTPGQTAGPTFSSQGLTGSEPNRLQSGTTGQIAPGLPTGPKFSSQGLTDGTTGQTETPQASAAAPRGLMNPALVQALTGPSPRRTGGQASMMVNPILTVGTGGGDNHVHLLRLPELGAESAVDLTHILHNVHRQAHLAASPVTSAFRSADYVLHVLRQQALARAAATRARDLAVARARALENARAQAVVAQAAAAATTTEAPEECLEEDDESKKVEAAASAAAAATTASPPTATASDGSGSPTTAAAVVPAPDNTGTSAGDAAVPAVVPPGTESSGSDLAPQTDPPSSSSSSSSSSGDTFPAFTGSTAAGTPSDVAVNTIPLSPVQPQPELILPEGVPVLTPTPEGLKINILNRANKLVNDLANGLHLDLNTNEVTDVGGLDPSSSLGVGAATGEEARPKAGSFYVVKVDPVLNTLSLEPVRLTDSILAPFLNPKTGGGGDGVGGLGAVTGPQLGEGFQIFLDNLPQTLDSGSLGILQGGLGNHPAVGTASDSPTATPTDTLLKPETGSSPQTGLSGLFESTTQAGTGTGSEADNTPATQSDSAEAPLTGSTSVQTGTTTETVLQAATTVPTTVIGDTPSPSLPEAVPTLTTTLAPWVALTTGSTETESEEEETETEDDVLTTSTEATAATTPASVSTAKPVSFWDTLASPNGNPLNISSTDIANVLELLFGVRALDAPPGGDIVRQLTPDGLTGASFSTRLILTP